MPRGCAGDGGSPAWPQCCRQCGTGHGLLGRASCGLLAGAEFPEPELNLRPGAARRAHATSTANQAARARKRRGRPSPDEEAVARGRAAPGRSPPLAGPSSVPTAVCGGERSCRGRRARWPGWRSPMRRIGRSIAELAQMSQLAHRAWHRRLMSLPAQPAATATRRDDSGRRSFAVTFSGRPPSSVATIPQSVAERRVHCPLTNQKRADRGPSVGCWRGEVGGVWRGRGEGNRAGQGGNGVTASPTNRDQRRARRLAAVISSTTTSVATPARRAARRGSALREPEATSSRRGMRASRSGPVPDPR